MLYCCTGIDGTIWGCPPTSRERYGEGGLRDRSFKEIWRGVLGDIGIKGWFVRMGVIVLGDDER